MRAIRALPRRELAWLAACMAAGVALRVAYVLATRDVGPAGDEPFYDETGRFAAEQGRWLWSTTPYGIAHPSVWKMPLYPLWVGGAYSLLGADPLHARLVQTLIGPVVIGLTWLLARRLFGPRAALAAAAVVAVYPFAWQFEARLYPESLATPLTLLFLLVLLDRRPPSARGAAIAGALLAANLYVRPSALMLAAGLAVAYVVAAGARRAAALLAVVAAVTALALVPWWARTLDVEGAFMPFSTQDAALYGTFNDEAARDPVYPWAWRPLTERDAPLFDPAHPLPEHVLRARLRENGFDYIREHPSSLPKAFFWNGIVRLWDIRRPARVLDEVPFEGRSRLLTWVGLLMYWPLLVLAVLALWRLRRERAIVLPLLAIALAASVIYTADAGTRYRAPLEPLIVILACAQITSSSVWKASSASLSTPNSTRDPSLRTLISP